MHDSWVNIVWLKRDLRLSDHRAALDWCVDQLIAQARDLRSERERRRTAAACDLSDTLERLEAPLRSMLAPENRTALVGVGDVDGLAQQMDALARDPALRMALREANRERAVSEYDREACYGRYCELYARVSSGPR